MERATAGELPFIALTLAEPGALIGFLGPRVAEAITGQPFPPGVQTAENLHAHGITDAVVPAPELAARLAGTGSSGGRAGPAALAEGLRAELASLSAMTDAERLAARTRRFRNLA